MKTNRGFIKLILLLIVGVLALSYFGISIKGIIESPVGQENLTILGKAIIWVWDNILKPLFAIVYRTIILPLLIR